MITNHETGEWVKLMATIEHEPEYTGDELAVTLNVLPGLLKPQALDLPREIRNGLVREFAYGADRIHV